VAPVVPHPKRIKAFRDWAAFEEWMAAHHDSEPEILGQDPQEGVGRGVGDRRRGWRL